MRVILILLFLITSHPGHSQSMSTLTIDPEIKELTQGLIDNGTIFNLEYLDRIYDDNLKYIRVDKDNNILVLTKQDNMEFFESLKNSGAEPLSKYAEFHYADNDGKRGYIILTRKMKRQGVEQEFLFNIYWEKMDGEWRIIRETVFLK